ncbi:MAG TPA: hypothetical protein VD969_16175 [Symbiobacteriaceae bacterium]|nr:hypothetical protein [Symbiobacteriaceae bacterium]
MEVRINGKQYQSVPEQIAPLLRAYAGLQGRSVSWDPDGALAVSAPEPPPAPAPIPVTGPDRLLPAGDGQWISPRARALEEQPEGDCGEVVT